MLHLSCPAFCLNHYVINACNLVMPASLLSAAAAVLSTELLLLSLMGNQLKFF